MSNRWLTSLGCVLALAFVPLATSAQREGSDDPPKDVCRCTGDEAECLFGYAAGCEIECKGRDCVCKGARCILGFPRPASCRCKGPAAPQA